MSDELLNKKLEALPLLYATDGLPREAIHCPFRLFNMVGVQQWFPIEWDPLERVFFGYADLGLGFYPECGYTSLDELLAIKTHLFLLDLDLFWKPKTLKEVMKNIENS